MRVRPCELIAPGVVRVPLSQGRFALIDESDWTAIGQFNWCVRSADKNSPYIYAMRWRRVHENCPNNVLMHRQLLGVTSDIKVDHRNGDTLDNRRENLRICTRGQNKQNTRSISARSGFKGVFAHGSHWVARICCSGEIHDLGKFDTPELAAIAYDAAARKLFGEFACTNADLGRLKAATNVEPATFVNSVRAIGVRL